VKGRALASALAVSVAVSLVASFAAVPGAGASTASGASAASAAAPKVCRAVPAGSLHVLTALKNRTPVLFVHGFSGRPADFTNSHAGIPSMASTVGRVQGVATATFDYSQHALDWVTDEHIGPALADAIVCLAKQSHHPVVVVSHSMGGLAARYAQAQTVAGTPVASVIDRVVTIGTPSNGSQLLGLEGSPAAPLLQTLLDGARDVCGGKIPARPSRDVCDLIGSEVTPAVRGLTPGSSQLAALPPWDPRLIVHAVAGNLSLYVRVLGLEQSVSVGDILVSVDSATAGASKGDTPLVVACRSTVSDVTSVIDDSPCSHGQLLRNRRIIGDVSAQVRAAVHDGGTLA
jgi:pimeloyl-ACP methyl ester carboxylesterase